MLLRTASHCGSSELRNSYYRTWPTASTESDVRPHRRHEATDAVVSAKAVLAKVVLAVAVLAVAAGGRAPMVITLIGADRDNHKLRSSLHMNGFESIMSNQPSSSC